MRIVAGSARGRILRAPKGDTTRPTSDKVRAAIFNLLGQFFEGGQVLDLYAGSGAMALEALSRGCAAAICVESDPNASDIIWRNAEACGLAHRVEVRREMVESALARLPRAAFHWVFVDPPYLVGTQATLDQLSPLVAPAGWVVAEHDHRCAPAERVGLLELSDRRRYGSTGVSIYRLK